MKKINKNNYELFFVDYLDNNLDINEIAELMIFLTENPDLEIDLEEVRSIKLSKPKNYFNKKNLLYKESSINDFENNCIAFLENDMSESEKENFLNEINLDNEKNKTLELFKNTKFNKNSLIKYKNKDVLKRKLKKSYKNKLILSYISSAAAVIIFILFFNFFNHNKKQPINYDKSNFSYLDNNIINDIQEILKNINDGNFIPNLYTKPLSRY